jgi:hypothetical protein
VAFVLVGLDIEEKARVVRAQLEAALERRPSEMTFTLLRTDREDADDEARASALLRVTVKDQDPSVVGRAFSSAAVALALGSYPGFTMTAPPGDASPYGVYTAAYVDAAKVEHLAVLDDGTRIVVPHASITQPLEDVAPPALPPPIDIGDTSRMPLGRVMGARSGDKGGVANVGVWARSDDAFRWLVHTLDEDAFRTLLPETRTFPIVRHVFPKIRALNFVIDGLLGEGVASSTRFDPQAKALGEWLRSRHGDVPRSLL